MNTNRYRNSFLVRDEAGDWVSPVQPFTDSRERRSDILHTVVDHDRLDALASKYLGSPLLWWIIAEYNEILWFQDLEVGEVLRIPSFETTYLELLRR